jgi:hypothetical protein
MNYIIKTFIKALQAENSDVFSLATDAIVAFLSELQDYFNNDKIFDARMESLEERKERM